MKFCPMCDKKTKSKKVHEDRKGYVMLFFCEKCNTSVKVRYDYK